MTNPVTLEVCIIGSDYILEDGKPVVRLWGKTSKGETVLLLDRKFRPYFYVEPKPGFEIIKALPEGQGWIVPEKVETVEKRLYGKPKSVIKFVLTSPSDVPKFKIGIERLESVKATYEYNIAYYKRYLIDKGIIPLNWILVSGEGQNSLEGGLVVELESIEHLPQTDYPKIRMLTFDTEVVEKDGERWVVVISFNSNYGFRRTLVLGYVEKKNVECFDDENSLLHRFIGVLKTEKFDILCGYNTDGFDFPLIVERANKYNIKLDIGFEGKEPVFVMKGSISSFSITGKIHIDLYNFVENIVSNTLATEVLSLDRVSRELVGEGKKRVEWVELKNSWERGEKERLVEYCEKDAELTLKLANVLVPQIFELSRVSGQIPFDTSRMSYSQLVEWLFIRKSYEVGELVPNRPGFEEIRVRQLTQSYQGGYVHTPKNGLHHDVALFDFRSLYPSIIIAHNISPETLNCGCCSTLEDRNVISKDKNKVPEETYYFCINHKGFIPEIIEGLLRKRTEIQQEIKTLENGSVKYKDLNNRQYAIKILANASYGYYGYPGSRWFSTICAKSITAWGRYYIKKVIDFAERDREVIYGDTDSLFVKMGSGESISFIEEVNKTLPEGLKLELRGIYKSCLFVLSKKGTAAKKRYALIDKEGNIIIRGFEKVRRDWSKIARDAQEKVLVSILMDADHKAAFEEVKNLIEKVGQGKIDLKDLVIYTQLTKPLESYEQLTPHVMAAKKAIAKGVKISEGSVIGYVITRGTGPLSERAEILELANNYDPDYYINNQIIPAALRVLSEFGYSEKDFIGEKQQSLAKFINRENKKEKKFLQLKYKI